MAIGRLQIDFTARNFEASEQFYERIVARDRINGETLLLTGDWLFMFWLLCFDCCFVTYAKLLFARKDAPGTRVKSDKRWHIGCLILRLKSSAAESVLNNKQAATIAFIR